MKSSTEGSRPTGGENNNAQRPEIQRKMLLYASIISPVEKQRPAVPPAIQRNEILMLHETWRTFSPLLQLLAYTTTRASRVQGRGIIAATRRAQPPDVCTAIENQMKGKETDVVSVHLEGLREKFKSHAIHCVYCNRDISRPCYSIHCMHYRARNQTPDWVKKGCPRLRIAVNLWTGKNGKYFRILYVCVPISNVYYYTSMSYESANWDHGFHENRSATTRQTPPHPFFYLRDLIQNLFM